MATFDTQVAVIGGGVVGCAVADTLPQIQADALGLPLLVGRADATVLGAALLAGVGAGTFASVRDAAQRLPEGRVIEPRAPAASASANASAGARSSRPAQTCSSALSRVSCGEPQLYSRLTS
jgi:sugar (pentulose or hexulose) kinase